MLKKDERVRSFVGGGNGAERKIFYGIFSLAFVLILLAPDRSDAIPAFSRLYNTECTTCHTIYPQRNEFGNAFEKNGYVWPGAKPLPTQTPVPQTEDEKKLKEVLLITGLPKILPISLFGTYGIVYDKTADDHLNFNNYEVDLLAAGSLRDTISFYVNEILATSDDPGHTDLGEGFVMWRHALGSPINLKVGKFQPNVSLWKENNSLIEAPATLTFTVDNFSLADSHGGAELNAVLASRLFVAAGVQDSADNNDKNYYGHVSYKIGGTDFRGKEPDLDLDKENSVWDFLSVKVGAFLYEGKTVDPTDNQHHNFYRAGLETEVLYKKWLLRLGGVTGENRYSFDPKQKSKVFSGDVQYQFTSKLIALVRYDYVDVGGSPIDRHIIPSVIYAPFQNFKVIMSVDHEKSDITNTTGLLRLQFAI